MKKIKNLLFMLTIALVGILTINNVHAAENYGLWVNGEEFTSEKTTINCGSGTATFNNSTQTLTLNNATISEDTYSGIMYDELKDLTIVLSGKNIISNADTGISTSRNITIQGSGSLNITANSTGIKSYDGEGGWYDIIINSGDIIIAAQDIKDSDKFVLDNYEGKIMQGHYLDGTNADVVSKEKVLKWPNGIETCSGCNFQYLRLGNFETYPIDNIATPKNHILSTPSQAFEGEKIRIEGGMDDAGFVRLYEMNSARVLNELGNDISEDLNYNPDTKEFLMPTHKVVINAKFTKNFKLVPKTFTSSLYGYKSIKLSWNQIPGINRYHIYYKKGTDKSYSLLATTNYTYTLKRIGTAGKKYTFKIVPYGTINENKVLSDSYKTTSIYTLKKMNTPTVTKYSNSKVRVRWSKVNGATKYQIARSVYKTKNYTTVKTVGSGYIGYKISAKRYKTYYYKVRACKGTICAPWSNYKSFRLQ